MTFSQQSPAIQRLLNRMREVGWGKIENLQIRNGEPILGTPTHIRRDISLDKDYVPSRYRPEEKLKPHVVKLLKEFRKTRDGTVPMIRIQDGLPFRLQVDEQL